MPPLPLLLLLLLMLPLPLLLLLLRLLLPPRPPLLSLLMLVGGLGLGSWIEQELHLFCILSRRTIAIAILSHVKIHQVLARSGS